MNLSDLLAPPGSTPPPTSAEALLGAALAQSVRPDPPADTARPGRNGGR
jgi:hypothetical protein